MTDLYFAYGSNMNTARMRARISEAQPVSPARLAGHRLVCDKRGVDGSGKANLRVDPVGTAWGVIYRIPKSAWDSLDRFEVAYARHFCQLTTTRGEPLAAQLYLAVEPNAAPLPPFDWYRDHMLLGAREHGLPADLIDEIASWPTLLDTRTVSLDQT